jgi:hypothetical protein
MSLITGNKVKKTHKPRYCEKEKDKANKRILRSINKNNTYCYFHDLCAKKMFEQKRFAGRHLLTFESQKLNYFGKKGGPALPITNYVQTQFSSRIILGRTVLLLNFRYKKIKTYG